MLQNGVNLAVHGGLGLGKVHVVLGKRVLALSKAKNSLLKVFDRGLPSVMLRHGSKPKGRSNQIGRANY